MDSTIAKNEIKREVAAVFQKNFDQRYENLTKEVTNAILESLSGSKQEIMSAISINSASFSNIVDEKWEEYERKSPGKLKIDIVSKQKIIIKDISEIQQSYTNDCLKQFYQMIFSKIIEAETLFEESIKSKCSLLF